MTQVRAYIMQWRLTELGEGRRRVDNPLLDELDAWPGGLGIRVEYVYAPNVTASGKRQPGHQACLALVMAPDTTDLSPLDSLSGLRRVTRETADTLQDFGIPDSREATEAATIERVAQVINPEITALPRKERFA